MSEAKIRGFIRHLQKFLEDFIAMEDLSENSLGLQVDILGAQTPWTRTKTLHIGLEYVLRLGSSSHTRVVGVLLSEQSVRREEQGGPPVSRRPHI